jgi:drug/metabolite transporter (DMT)-like permease
MYIKGIELSGVVVATSMQPAIPVFTALFGVAMGLESPSFLKMVGIAMAVLGAVSMVLGGGAELPQDDNTASEGLYLGNACLLVNTIAMAMYYVLGKSVVQRHSPATVASWAYLIAATLMGCAAAVFVEPSDWHLPRSLWGPLAFWIFVCSVGGYLLVTIAIRHLPASQVAAFQCLQPVLGMVLAFTVLNESPKWWDLGALGILGGLWLVSQSSRKDAETNRVAAAAVTRIKYLLGNSGGSSSSSSNLNGGGVLSIGNSRKVKVGSGLLVDVDGKYDV